MGYIKGPGPMDSWAHEYEPMGPGPGPGHLGGGGLRFPRTPQEKQHPKKTKLWAPEEAVV